MVRIKIKAFFNFFRERDLRVLSGVLCNAINLAVSYHFLPSLQHPLPSTHLWVFEHYLSNSICLLEGLKVWKLKLVTQQVVQEPVLAGKTIISLQPFLKQQQLFNLVNYSSKLLQSINNFNKFKVLVLQGMQILLLITVQQPQNQYNHFLVCVRGRSASSDVSSNISPSPLYIPPHCR